MARLRGGGGVTDLGENIVERGRADDRETDQEHVRLGVGERTETIIILLSGGIPQAQADRLVVDHNVGGVIVEAGDIGNERGEFYRGEADQRDGTYTVGMYSPGKALVV